ncbi:DNA polymerase III subunit beta [Proteocatella sphenisci]|uniref:DNA polymerase III subunit beta n=1 Tax=Proteocatella sphenisci TaxID=181070 RepID=UPI00048DBA85|nr:DNA polymerase III subunit beta [Proteocatella sphenisci]
MKFSIEQKQFQNALSIALKGISSKNIMEILKGIYIEAEDDHITLTSNNLEIGVKTRVQAEVSESGIAIIEGKILSDIVRKLPDEKITISVNDNNVVKISTSKTKFNIKSMINNQFPQVEEFENDRYEKIDMKLFSDMVRKTHFAASQDETKGVLTGSLIEIDSNSISMVSIDGFRLAIKRIPTNYNLGEKKVVVPVKTLQEVTKLSSNENCDLRILFEERNVSFVIDNTIINSRVLEGEFLNYKQIIPKEFMTKIKINNHEFISSLERAMLVSNNNLVKLVISDDTVVVSAKNSEIGNLEEDIPVNQQGKDLEIAFNIKYFLDCLKNLDEEYIYMNFNTNLSPCVINPESDEDYTYLLLPVRL